IPLNRHLSIDCYHACLCGAVGTVLAFGSSLPFLFEGGAIAIGFSLFVIVIASFTLLLDFDNIDRGVAMGVSEDYEWLFSIGILATLVWMYIEFMRLLSYLQD